MKPDEIAQTLRRAVELHRGGQLPEAARVCESLLGVAAAAPDALQLLGLIRKQEGKLDEAERMLRASADLVPDRAEFQNNLGNLLTQIGRHDEAGFVYGEALRMDPEFRPARLGLARLYNRAARFDDAEGVARELIARNAADVQAFVVLGTALRGQDRLADAEAAYRQAITLQPANAVALHNLGTVLADRYHAREALQCYVAANRAGVSGPEFEANRARALIALDRIDDAYFALELAVERYPRAADPQALLAKLRYMRGEEDFARDLRDALDRHGGDELFYRTYAQLLRGAGRPADAVTQLSSAIDRLGANPVLLAELASAHQEQGEFEAALISARKASSLQPENLRLSDRVVEALMSLGRAEEAAVLITTAREREPHNQWHLACEATVARMQGTARYDYLYDYDRFVGVYELPVPQGWSSLTEFNEDFAALLRERDSFQVAPLDQSLRNGTQTPVSLLADEAPLVKAYLQAVIEPVTEFRQRIGADPDHPFTARNQGLTVIAGAWSVCLRDNGYHVNHVHPEGWISSAYYVAVPPEVDDAVTRNGWIKFGEPRYPVPGLGADYFVQPKRGRLVLFPSYFWHGTNALHSSAPRVTAPFDVVTAPTLA